MTYRIKTVAALTGIPRATLLTWERRYELLEPRRSENGYRIYTDDDVAHLRRLKAAVDAGHPIGEAVALVRRASPNASPDDGALRGRLLDALLRYDREAVDALAPEVARRSFLDALDDLFLPMLQHVGDEWERGRVSVAQEHHVSNWCREQMLAMLHALGSGPAGGPSVVCAMAPGELHELGLLAVAIRLRLLGWRVTWLGADVPTGDLVVAVRDARPRLLCLSRMMPVPSEEVVAHARDLRKAIPGSVLIAVGGVATRTLEAASADGLLFCPTYPSLQAALPTVWSAR